MPENSHVSFWGFFVGKQFMVEWNDLPYQEMYMWKWSQIPIQELNPGWSHSHSMK